MLGTAVAVERELGGGMATMLEVLRSPALVELGIATLCEFAAGERIVTEGATDRRLYLVEHGLVRVTEKVELEDRRQIQPGLGDLGVDEVFGELGLIDDAPRSASVVAVDPCRLRVFDADRLMLHLDRHPEQGHVVMKGLLRLVSERLRRADRRFGSLLAWGLKVHGIDAHL